MHKDFGLRVSSGGHLTAPTIPAYDIANTDLTITCLIQTKQAGVIIAFQSADSEKAWVFAVNAKGALTASIGVKTYTSLELTLLDDAWHGVAFIRNNDQCSFYCDGMLYDATESESAVAASNDDMLIIGDDAKLSEQFIGILEDISIWSYGLSKDEILKTMLHQVDRTDPRLAGLWEMNNVYDDTSSHANPTTPHGDVDFIPICHCMWNRGANKYAYFAIDVNPQDYCDENGRSIIKDETVTRRQAVTVESGTPFLYGGILDKSKNDFSFPTGAKVEVYRPDGTRLDTDEWGDDLFVQRTDNSIHAFTVKNPAEGTWIVEVTCPPETAVLISLQTTPTTDVANTIGDAVGEIYGNDVDFYIGDGASRLKWSWSKIALAVGVTLTVVAVVAVAAAVVVASGGAAVPLVVLQATTAVGLAGSALTTIGLIGITSAAESSKKTACGMKIGADGFGGQGNGEFAFLHDGREYFLTMRDLLLAVGAGHYDPQGITVPANPTFENLVRAAGSANRNAYILMWDTSVVYHMIENDDWLKYWLRRWWNSDDARRNARTIQALAGAKNVDARLEPYTEGSYFSPTSQHEKIAVFSVNGEKCALVGGFNVITPAYWDDPDHPMYPDAQGKRNYHSWHDTAVLVTGDLAQLVEYEFDRRWNNTCADPDKIIQRDGTYAKISGWEIQHQSCLDEWSVCNQGTQSKTPYSDPRTKTIGATCADVLITNAQDPTNKVAQIRNKLVEKVKAAQSYIYFENFALHDPKLVQAIGSRLGAASGDFKVVILTPHPTEGADHQDQLGQFWLTRIGFAGIALATNEWVDFTTMSGQTITRESCDNWAVNFDDGAPIERGMFSCSRSRAMEYYPLRDVKDVTLNSDSRLILSSPARYFTTLGPDEQKYELKGWTNPHFRAVYVHSKLALIDDVYAVVGSANFTSRSLTRDGECSIGIDGASNVAVIRAKLFSHWGVDTVADWRRRMNDFVTTKTDGLGVVPLMIGNLGDVEPTWALSIASAVIDPSDVF